MIDALLPAAVRAVEVFADPPDAELHPEEHCYVARAVESRRAEFTTGRHCARTALDELGVPTAVIGRGDRGEPCWPAGVVGSITHCAGYRAAAVARVSELTSVGIDAEPNEPLPDGVLDVVSLPQERTRLAAAADAVPGIAWDRVLFSAKESVYKTWFPLTGAWLDFHDADVSFDPARDTFVARILAPDATAVGDLRGRFAVRDGLVVTAIVR